MKEIAQAVMEARDRIAPYTYTTSVEQHTQLGEALGLDVYLKYEMQQISGSFKARGAFNRILAMSAKTRSEAFFVAASTGNHAAAFCTALQSLGLRGKVFLPESVSDSKLSYIQSFGIPYELHGANSLHTELYCRKLAEDYNFTMVHPYNDPLIVAGQGTVACEVLAQVPEADVIVVPVGGGGLMSGMAAWIKTYHPKVHLVGVQPVQSPEMVRSIEQGSILTEDISQPTLSDGTAGGMEPDSITFPLCRDLVDEWWLAGEEAIAHEIRALLSTQQILAEGSAVLPLAYLRAHSQKWSGRKVVTILTGKRIPLNKLQSILCA